MAILASCWLFIEVFIVPNGLTKWYFLSFYIHPFLLVFCQIFLWIERFRKLLSFILCFLYEICSYPFFIIFSFMKRSVMFFWSSIRPAERDVFYEIIDHEIEEIMMITNQMIMRSTGVSVFALENSYCEKVEENVWISKSKDSWLGDYLMSDQYKSSPLYGYPDMVSDQETISETESSENDFVNMYPQLHEDIVMDRMALDSQTEVRSFTYPQLEDIVCDRVDFDSQTKEVRSFMYPQLEDIVSDRVDLDSQIEEVRSFMYPQLEDIVSDRVVLASGTEEVPSFSFPNPKKGTNGIITSEMLSSALAFINQAFTDNVHDHEADSQEYLGSFKYQQELVRRSVDEDRNTFHKNYTQRMKFFDVLYDERLYGINEISKVDTMSPRSSSVSTMSSPSSFLTSEMETRMLMRSLEYDFELVCIAQTCLSWEALHYQYQKVESLSSNSRDCLLSSDDLENFQKFQILLQRFMEDEKSLEGKRSSRSTRRRCQLQVPDVSVIPTSTIEEGNIGTNGEAVRAIDVSNAIDKCINTFWTYVNTETKKPVWKFKGFLRSQPPVEDPRDLELLYNLTNTLRKKEQVLKDRGRKKSWPRRKAKPFQVEGETKDVMFAMIDLKLVEKVLKMSIVSRSHLLWCKDKLDNIEFREGSILRDSSSCLFPST